MAHFPNFSFEFFYAVFTEDASLLFYTMVQKVINGQKLKSRGDLVNRLVNMSQIAFDQLLLVSVRQFLSP